MTKYSAELTEKICTSIRQLKGRVAACKENKIGYDAFSSWMKTKPEFSEAIKKAEAEASGTGREEAIMCIFRAMEKDQWQAAAWWLERKFKGEFAKLADIKLDYSKLSDAELETALRDAYRELADAGIFSNISGDEEAHERERANAAASDD